MEINRKRQYSILVLFTILFILVGQYNFFQDALNFLYLNGYEIKTNRYIEFLYYDGIYLILPLFFIFKEREGFFSKIKKSIKSQILLWILCILTLLFLQNYISYLFSPNKRVFLIFYKKITFISFFEIYTIGLFIREVFYRWFFPKLFPKDINSLVYFLTLGIFYGLSFNIMQIPFFYKVLLGITSTLIFFLSKNIIVSYIFTYGNLFLISLPVRELEDFSKVLIFSIIFLPFIIFYYLYKKKNEERICLEPMLSNYKVIYKINFILIVFGMAYSKVDGYLYIAGNYSNNKETYELNLYNFKGVYSKEFDMIEMTEYRIGFEGAEFEYIYIDKIMPVENGLYEYNYYSVPIDIRDGIYSSYDVNEGDYYAEESKYRITFKTKGVARGAKIVFDTIRER